MRCSELAATRKTVVFGAGNADAELMFVGEAPGASEDEQGLPFVGRAGKLLATLLGEIGMERADVFIANVLKCRPPNNRDPQPVEIDNCREYLFRQVELIEPAVICTLGNFSTKLLRGDPAGITRVHGQPEVILLGRRAVRLYPIFHPAAALYTPRMLETLREDFVRLPELLALGAPEQPRPDSLGPGAADPHRRGRRSARRRGSDGSRPAGRGSIRGRPARALLKVGVGDRLQRRFRPGKGTAGRWRNFFAISLKVSGRDADTSPVSILPRSSDRPASLLPRVDLPLTAGRACALQSRRGRTCSRNLRSPQTEALGAELAAGLSGGDVVLLRGELGSGKTTLVRGAARALGVSAPVTSPTFSIGHRYEWARADGLPPRSLPAGRPERGGPGAAGATTSAPVASRSSSGQRRGRTSSATPAYT